MAAALGQVASGHPDLYERLEASPPLAAALVVLADASPALVSICARRDGALDVLSDLDLPEPGGLGRSGGPDPESLVERAELALLRIAGRDLVGLSRLEEVGADLASLAAGVLEEAFAACGVVRSAAIGMGKLGGAELNYSSDVDLLLVGDRDDEPALRRAIELARSCFRVDLGLRPEGAAGALVRSVDSYRSYWQRWAQPWEFQALLKARPVAGNTAVSAEIEAAAAQALWSKRWGAEELRHLRHLKKRAEELARRRGLAHRELKRGLGGIRDAEFAIQLLQLVHGGNDATLRSPNTLRALDSLARGGYVSWADASSLAGGYRFLRATEHRVQLVQLSQTHVIPEDPLALERLARSMGFAEDSRASASDRFLAEMRRRRSEVRSVHERLWFRPLLDAFASPPDSKSALRPEAASERLRAAGFADLHRTQVATEELTRGLSRYSGLMRQMLPLLMSWLADSPEPELGLVGLRNLSAVPHSRERLGALLRDSPEAAMQLCVLMGTSRLFVDAFGSDPDLLGLLERPESLSARGREEIVEAAASSPRLRQGRAGAGAFLRRLSRRETAVVAVRDVLGLASPEETEASLARVAEAMFELSLGALPPPAPLAAIAMGRFGGHALSYASDVDIVLVARPGAGQGIDRCEAHATELLRLLRGETPAARVLEVDTSLRPEGKDGPLVRSIDAFARYFEHWASTWERQAYLRARPIAGDAQLCSDMSELISGFVFSSELSAGEVREIRRLKARMERERIPPGEDPQFHLKLGRGSLSDVEWTVQLAQLRAQVPGQSTLEALAQLVDRGVFEAEEGEALAASYRFCTLARNRLFLVTGRAMGSLPAKPELLARLATSMGTTGSSLREEYRRVTRRARGVMERHFWAMQRE